MWTSTIFDIANLLDVNIDEMDMGEPLFTDPRYQAVPFDKGNFRTFDIGKLPEGEVRRLAFVDGGNLEILRAPNFSVQLVRVYYNIFEGRKRIVPSRVPIRIDFFVTALARFMDGKVYYSGLLLPLVPEHEEYLPSGEHLMVDPMDKKIATGGFRADISVMGQLTRRFAEWLMAARVMREELGEGDLLVRDGTLQTAVSNERYYADEAFKAADEKGVLLGGVAKTSTLLTTTGLSLLATVQRMSKDMGLDGDCWYYSPIAENMHPDHPAEMYVSKLFPDSKYVFRTELYKPQAEAMEDDDIDDVFAHLARNSADLSFQGYPYGLVDADNFARVGFQESGLIKNLINNTLSGQESFEKITRHLTAMNAHSVLDSI